MPKINQIEENTDRHHMIFICQVKQLIKKLLEEGTIAMYCDFHAHSRKVKITLFFADKNIRDIENKS